MRPPLTTAEVVDVINETGAIADIGQITPEVQRELKARVKAGALGQYRGYWDTKHSGFGMGPLKTIYALPAVATEARRLGVAG